jgi:GNAT superfamily N-acetyltransferase
MPISTPAFLAGDPTRAQLLRAVARNHVQMWIHGARLRGGEVHRENGAIWIYTPRVPGEVVVPFPRMTHSRASEQLDVILRYCARRMPLGSVACWSLGPPQPRDLGARLLARGFEWGWQPHWMWLDYRNMSPDHPCPPGLRISLAEDASARGGEDVPYYASSRWSASGDAAGGEAERFARPRRMWRFVACLDGRVVGHSALFVTTGRLGVAGIYGCGVAPEARNQGIGKAVTLAACRFAERMGCGHALLNATALGEATYRRLGFVSLGYGQTWWLHRHVMEAPPPTEAAVRFVEAVGTGDVAALAALSDHVELETLDAALPCGMTPLQVAAQLGQPAAAEWLVERGATPDLVCAWDLGWKDRVRQLSAMRPGLVNRRSGSRQITPLHVAAERDDRELARLLLAAGAELEIEDPEFHSTPLGWARFFERTAIVAMIEQHQARKGS